MWAVLRLQTCRPAGAKNHAAPAVENRDFNYGSSGSFASKNSEATDGLNSAVIGDIRVIDSIGKYPNSVEQRMRNPSLVMIPMWSSLEVTKAFK